MRKQTKEELENWYKNEDPWKYKDNKADIKRKNIILKNIPKIKSVLDVGCGEGWITKDIKADFVMGIDISEKAIKRCELKNKKVFDIYNDNTEELGKFDLVLVTGVTYGATEEDIKKIIGLTSKYILSCQIKGWNYGKQHFDKYMKKVKEMIFDYKRGLEEELILYKL